MTWLLRIANFTGNGFVDFSLKWSRQFSHDRCAATNKRLIFLLIFVSQNLPYLDILRDSLDRS
jgi:hypothetical protein